MVSLSKLASVTEEGVTFSSPYDGSVSFLTPERSIEIQQALGLMQRGLGCGWSKNRVYTLCWRVSLRLGLVLDSTWGFYLTVLKILFISDILFQGPERFWFTDLFCFPCFVNILRIWSCDIFPCFVMSSITQASSNSPYTVHYYYKYL